MDSLADTFGGQHDAGPLPALPGGAWTSNPMTPDCIRASRTGSAVTKDSLPSDML